MKELNMRLINNAVRMRIGIDHDTAKRRKTEEAIHLKRERLGRLLEAMSEEEKERYRQRVRE